MGKLTVIIANDPTQPLVFSDLDFNLVTPEEVIAKVAALGRKPSGGRIWKMTKTSTGVFVALNSSTSLTKNGIADLDKVFLVEQ